MKLNGKEFSFYRADGSVIYRNIILKDDHHIQGAHSPNEHSWSVQNGKLVFTTPEGKVMTYFHTKVNLDGKWIFFGKFNDTSPDIWHILVEKSIADLNTHAKIDICFRNLGEHLNIVTDHVKATSKQIVRLENKRERIKVLFLIHNESVWDSIADVYEEMMLDKHFEVIVASIPRAFLGEDRFGHEEEIHQFLEEKKIQHIRFRYEDYHSNLFILRQINPNAVFRQSPWDQDIPSEFNLDSIAFTNIFYVPYYGFNILDSFLNSNQLFDAYSNLTFHKACAQVFCESELTKKIMSSNSSRGGG